jgi:hypothetical protein
MEYSTKAQRKPELLAELLALLEAHRGAFRQDRPYWRAMSLVLAEVFSFARHTVTQLLMSLGLMEEDWTGFYRLFSRERFDEAKLSAHFFEQTLRHVPMEQVYTLALDATQIPRSSMKMPGTSWLKASRTAPFRPGIHRAQRFEHGSWLTPIEEGYSRAIPIRWLPAYPEKAVASVVGACKEWAAGLKIVQWVREELDHHARREQRVLCLGDGVYDNVEFWKGLPERAIGVVRTARNRCLRHLPPPYGGRGRKRKYGERAATPEEWLHVQEGWNKADILVRGRTQPLRYRVEGPYLRERADQVPLFLLVVRGQEWQAGKQKHWRKRRDPAFFLISAERVGDGWRLPMAVEELLAWTWQRWEVEVTHREMKSGFGVGEKQCWNVRSATLAVQWSAWVYAVLVLAGYRRWGLLRGPSAPARWWSGAKRWSLNTLWRQYRTELWGTPQFRALWTGTANNWFKKETHLIGLWNATASAARA